MIPGIVAGQMRADTGPALWTPLNMATVPPIYLDAQDSTVTDVSGFASAISNLGSYTTNGDFAQATAGNRPAILEAELNGKRVLRFDSDFITCNTSVARNMLAAQAAAWSFLVYKKRATDGADTARFALQVTDNAGGTRFNHSVGWSTSGGANKQTMSVRRVDGAAAVTLIAATAKSTTYAMGLEAVNLSTRLGRIYLDGSIDAENATLTPSTGVFSNTLSSLPLSIGASSTGTFPSDIDLAAIAIGNVYPSDSDIDKLFGWAAHKYGLTASLPGGHPYKTTPPYA